MPAFFFDLDGTLFDTRADLAATVNHTRRDLKLPPLSLETAISHVGHGASYLLAHAIPEVTGREVRTIFFSHYAEHCCESLAPYPGVLETLAELRRRGHPLGINTSKPNFAVREILRRFSLSDTFGTAVVAGGDGFPLKPDPTPLRVCAERLGHRLSPDDWMVGDSHPDLKCAEAAGVKSAFCAFGFGSREGASYTVRLGRFPDLIGCTGCGGDGVS